jgi:RimJ/RimL family protein N-acetyltransferase
LAMRQEGVRRQAYFKGGKFVDVIEFGVLREEFLNAVL